MAIFSFVFEKDWYDEETAWTVEADRMDRQIASDIVRSICQPHEFGSVSFTVYEMTVLTEQADWKLYTPWGGPGVPKELFKTTVWGAEDMLDVLSRTLQQRIESPTAINQDETRAIEDLLTSLKANRRTLLRGLRSLGECRKTGEG